MHLCGVQTELYHLVAAWLRRLSADHHPGDALDQGGNLEISGGMFLNNEAYELGFSQSNQVISVGISTTTKVIFSWSSVLILRSQGQMCIQQKVINKWAASIFARQPLCHIFVIPWLMLLPLLLPSVHPHVAQGCVPDQPGLWSRP
jgi:hypothetical protein